MAETQPTSARSPGVEASKPCLSPRNQYTATRCRRTHASHSPSHSRASPPVLVTAHHLRIARCQPWSLAVHDCNAVLMPASARMRRAVQSNVAVMCGCLRGGSVMLGGTGDGRGRGPSQFIKVSMKQ